MGGNGRLFCPTRGTAWYWIGN